MNEIKRFLSHILERRNLVKVINKRESVFEKKKGIRYGKALRLGVWKRVCSKAKIQQCPLRILLRSIVYVFQTFEAIINLQLQI